MHVRGVVRKSGLVFSFLGFLITGNALAAKRSPCDLFYSLVSPSQISEMDQQGDRGNKSAGVGFDNFLLVMTKGSPANMRNSSPNSERRLVLVIIPYVAEDAHRKASQLVEELYETEIAVYMGAGELRRENGIYVAGTPVSGFVSEMPLGRAPNEITTVATVLKMRAPALFAKDFKPIPYVANARNIHLDPRLATTGPGSLKNIRHDAFNELDILFPNIDAAVKWEKARAMGDRNADAELKDIYAVIQRNTGSLELFISLFSADDQLQPRLQVVTRWLQRIQNGERLNLTEYRALKYYLESIKWGISDPAMTVIDLTDPQAFSVTNPKRP